ncbi:MAG: AAA family ATPase [Candidatus Aminicenantes bacterium]|nr:AAA family ATPase [Candidatus Aminicenantes bacterium]
MNDKRLDILKNAIAEPGAAYGPVRIERIKISNYKYFHGDFELAIAGKNLLMYGENGSGKSSIYKALCYLTKLKFDTISGERNIFCGNEEPQIEFGFSNGRELIIDSDLTELPDSVDFLRGLSVFTPMLDYKKLLKIHYTPDINGDSINIYAMLRELFRDYIDPSGKKLSEIKDFMQYFETLKSIVNGSLLVDINELIGFFDKDFKITKFSFIIETTPDGRPAPLVSIDIDFKDNPIERYHQFLNEARLSALAISVYFASIRKLLGSLSGECLKILALDDLLISLDMGNRFILIDILKTKFMDFQVFFFTHDKELFEIYKNKMDWEKYEIYADEADGIPKPLLKPHESEINRAKKCYAKKEIDCCAMLLRKEFERFLKTFLSPAEQRNKHGEELDLAALISRARSKTTGEARIILDRLDTNRKHLFNPQCHHDTRNIYTKEVKTAIDDLEKLLAILR